MLTELAVVLIPVVWLALTTLIAIGRRAHYLKHRGGPRILEAVSWAQHRHLQAGA